MTRPSFTPAQRLRCFEDHGAIVLCQADNCDSAMYIKGCDIDHWLALIDGGRHAQENFRPLCTACHAKKSAREHRENCRAKRRRAKYESPREPSRVWPKRKLESRPFRKAKP